MPTTRRSTGGTRARPGPGKGQSTISFSNKVTKSVPKDTKKAVISSPAVAKIVDPEGAIPAKDEVEDIIVNELDTREDEEAKPQVAVHEKTDAEAKAEKINDAQINKYWKSVESQRKAPRVHQEDLEVSEKVLRYFDVSSQYGPCIGIDRMKRWQRAERLGLSPPIEVLSVLLKEEKKGAKEFQTAQMDQILGSIALGA
ncbi:DNA polymerase delta subunit 4 [Tolypocladium ophioglossoides CBS 100239]|uniref:DNA polymerase delta subunit 4 n=1 Tax=Tolypocladium ophioglossoides (strain CBS 100239) TaxID=1163406 RepID=A0A0L0NK26_TOLOC|nr:DNA polymerase delta subunit 4 [Tolypocladium ophioglossoides CBS 100239]